jgi:Protein of unknown function (DUF3618)
MDQSTDRITAAPLDERSSTAEQRRVAYNETEPLHQIEKDIARTRVRLSATIEALERELSPDRIASKSVEGLLNALETARGSTRPQAWAYAIPLALIASGLGWLFMVRQRSSAVETSCNSDSAGAEEGEADKAPRRAAPFADLTARVGSLPEPDEKPPI